MFPVFTHSSWLCGLLSICIILASRSTSAEEPVAPPVRQQQTVDVFELAPGMVPPKVDRVDHRLEQTLIGDKPFLNDQPPAPVFQAVDSQLRLELEETKAELAKTKLIIGEVIEGQRLAAESRELPPLKDAEVRVFQLKNAKADAAAQKIELLFGTQPLRIAVDEASNGLIVFGKAEAIPQVEQLIIKLDELAVAGRDGFATVMVDRNVVTAPAARRTLLLRVFWLASGVQDLDSADGYLPAPVINSLAKLGLSDPRLVTQTVNSLSVEEGGSPMEFSTNVPAILFEQPVTLTCAGTMGATTDNRANVDMHLTVGGIGVNCELKGSLATPLGHFMVLGTANSVIPDFSSQVLARKRALEEVRALAQERAMEEARAQEAEEGAMGRGGEMAMRGGGGYGGRGGEMGRGMAMGELPAAKYNASRFAFVVQVIEAESFEPAAEGP